jgi:hypothetical protein
MSFSVEDILRSHGLSSGSHLRILKSNTEPVTGVREGVMWYSPATRQTRFYVDGQFRDASGLQNGKPVLISPNGTIFELTITDRGQVVSEDIGVVQSYKDKLILRSPSGINYEIFIDQDGILSTSVTSFAPSTFTVILKSPQLKRFGLSVDDDGRIWTDSTYQTETGPWVLPTTEDGPSFEITVDDDGALWSTLVNKTNWGVTSPGKQAYLVEINNKGEIVTSLAKDVTGIDMKPKILNSPNGNYLIGIDDKGSIATSKTTEVGVDYIRMQASDGSTFKLTINKDGGLQSAKE